MFLSILAVIELIIIIVEMNGNIIMEIESLLPILPALVNTRDHFFELPGIRTIICIVVFNSKGNCCIRVASGCTGLSNKPHIPILNDLVKELEAFIVISNIIFRFIDLDRGFLLGKLLIKEIRKRLYGNAAEIIAAKLFKISEGISRDRYIVIGCAEFCIRLCRDRDG